MEEELKAVASTNKVGKRLKEKMKEWHDFTLPYLLATGVRGHLGFV